MSFTNSTNDTGPPPITLMNLILSTEHPDPLGFSSVSGLYGPGAWSAWFLAIAASWLHLAYSFAERKSKFDVNITVYLLGLNWAAIDLIRHSRDLSVLYDANSEAEPWSKEAASVGAALTTVFWGFAHANLQLLICCGGLIKSSRRKFCLRRVYALASGILLPSISLIAMRPYLYLMHGPHIITDLIPAFYWKGMQSAPGWDTPYGHCTYIELSLLLGIGGAFLSLPIVCYGTHRISRHTLYPVVQRVVVDYFLPLWEVLGPSIMAFAYLLWVIFCVIAFIPGCLLLLFIACFTPLFMASTISWVLQLVMLSFMSVVYVCRAYLSGAAFFSSCFFMPCAPQSISETDQAGALFVASVLFVGGDVLLPLYRILKQKHMERREFEQNLDRSVAAGTMRRLIAEGLRNPVTRRVNSGIELEEGARNRATTIGPRHGDGETVARLY